VRVVGSQAPNPREATHVHRETERPTIGDVRLHQPRTVADGSAWCQGFQFSVPGPRSSVSSPWGRLPILKFLCRLQSSVLPWMLGQPRNCPVARREVKCRVRDRLRPDGCEPHAARFSRGVKPCAMSCRRIMGSLSQNTPRSFTRVRPADILCGIHGSIRVGEPWTSSRRASRGSVRSWNGDDRGWR